MTTGKVAIVTAAGSGMGAGAAKKLAADGFNVAILSSSGKGEALAGELGGIGVTGSNQSNDDLKKLVDMAVDKWGRVDALVNSAGHGPKGPILEISDEDWFQGMETYFLNVVRPTRLVTPVMQAQESGVIINISTYAVFEPDPTFPTSGVFRAGLAAFTKLFADKYAADNIRMNNVLPGFIDSLPGFRRCGLHHRAKHPGGWRNHSIGLVGPLLPAGAGALGRLDDFLAAEFGFWHATAFVARVGANYLDTTGTMSL